MKKIITFIAIVITAIATMTGCKQAFYNDSLNKEFTEFMVEHPDAVFYESHIVLDQNLEDVKSVNKLNVVECENVYQDSVFCHMIQHDFVEDTTNEEVVQDFWLGSNSINPTTLVLTLEDALKAYEASEFETTGNKVTLRSPVGPELLPPYYIIGQQNSPCFVKVDAMNGEVSLIR